MTGTILLYLLLIQANLSMFSLCSGFCSLHTCALGHASPVKHHNYSLTHSLTHSRSLTFCCHIHDVYLQVNRRMRKINSRTTTPVTGHINYSLTVLYTLLYIVADGSTYTTLYVQSTTITYFWANITVYDDDAVVTDAVFTIEICQAFRQVYSQKCVLYWVVTRYNITVP